MTIAVSLKLADDVILGVDSAVTLNAPKGGVLKVYENAEKLFQLGDKPIGIAAFGIDAIGSRSIGNYIREFEIANPNNVMKKCSTVKETVEELRLFFLQAYHKSIVPNLESQLGKKFEEIPDDKKPVMGLVVGGFSCDAYLSEVWLIIIPFHQAPHSARLWQGEHDFGSAWFALYEPIFRYVKGYDRRLVNELKKYLVIIHLYQNTWFEFYTTTRVRHYWNPPKI